jgi:DNA-binding CsgD family transcriptional regulator
VLFIEEMQSDWAQSGRKEGFDNEAAFQKLIQARDAAPDDSPQQDELQRQIDEMGARGGKGVPSAPFVKNTQAWTALTLKRMIRYAAENGFDSVACNQAGQATITPSDSAIYDMAREGKSAQEILAFIGASARRPFDRYLANALMNLGVSSKINLDAQGGWRFNSMKQSGKYAAAYNPSTDTVALFTPRERNEARAA